MHRPNLGSKVLALCERRLPGDWLERFGHSLLLLATFVDPQRFHGTVYRAANWTCVGPTQGFRRTAASYSAAPQSPKQVFVRALHPRARQRLAQPILDPRDHTEDKPKMTLTAVQMRALPDSFSAIPDPRRAAGPGGAGAERPTNRPSGFVAARVASPGVASSVCIELNAGAARLELHCEPHRVSRRPIGLSQTDVV